MFTSRDRRKITQVAQVSFGVMNLCDPYELSVYAWLVRHANPTTGQCNPSHKRLAVEAKISVRKTIDTLKSLREKCLIGWEDQWVDESRTVRRPNQYEVFDAPGDVELPQRQGGSASHAVGGTAPDAGGVVHTVQGGTAPRAEEIDQLEKDQSERESRPKPKPVGNSGPTVSQLALANEAYCNGKGTNPDTLTARRPKGRSDDDPAHRLAAWYASVARPDLDFDGLSENDWRCRWYAPAKELLRCKPDAEIRELVGWVFDPETRPYWRGLLRESIDSLRFQLLTTRDRRLDRDFQNHRATLAAGEPVRPKRAAGFGEVELLVEQVSKAWSRARAEADGPDVIDAFKANIAGLSPAAQAAALDVRRMIAMGARTFDVKAAFSAAYESHVNGSAGEAA